MTKFQRLVSHEEDWQKRLGSSAADLAHIDSHLDSILVASGKHSAAQSPPRTSTTNTSCSRSSPRTESEIIVRIDGMDLDEDHDAGASSPADRSPPIQTTSNRDSPDRPRSESHDPEARSHLVAPEKWDTAGNVPVSLESSALSDQSALTSPPSSTPASSKATTPINAQVPKEAPQLPAQPEPIVKTASTPETVPSLPMPKSPAAKKVRRRTFDVRPKVSIPTDLAPYEYANQCIAAAEASRLNPYALHQEEYLLLRDHISHSQVTTYLNIRNGILRLWLHNPRIGVGRDEAVGCAKDSRWFEVASVCYDWLVRAGYINFGCTEVPTQPRKRTSKGKGSKNVKTIVIIGAGMSGLGCARQLDSLFKQYAQQFQDLGDEPPHVIVLEGRNRVGGRVYSRAIDGSQSQRSMGFKGRRHSVECGGMIITGFDRGNPLNVLLRGQMGLPYYALRPETTLYDSNGKPVDEARDRLVEKLYNDCLERVSEYKFKLPPAKLIEGARDLMDEGRDSSSESQKTIAQAEEAAAALPQAPPVAEQSLGPQVSLVPVSTDRATGKAHVEPGTPATVRAAYKARLLGWALKEGVTEDGDLDLDDAAHSTNATLGSVMDLAISQYKNFIDLHPLDFRLMNWHVANLEYSNATNYNQLSIGGWDIDAGYEWEGKHTMVVGGYQSVPWGLGNAPSRLDIRKDFEVKRVSYDPEGAARAKVECNNGIVIDADYVVSTIPLGVLKHGNVEFDPPLPSWKTGPIARLGFGILNKVILVYQQAFWDTSRDIFGILRDPVSRHSVDQADYASQRGRCFQWFDVSHTAGVPVLLGLMAGDAGYDTEHSSNDDLVAEATRVLRGVFGAKVPQPIHSVVTRWGSDRFARGSYSSAGPGMQPEDYKLMARPVGNVFFAGEHTTETHPATVHGAYLTGLRAASEIITALLGPIQVPTPLIIPRESAASAAVESLKRKAESDNGTPTSPRTSKQARIDAYEIAAWEHIRPQIGERPWPPQKVAGNAYLLYSKQNFEAARQRCFEGRRPGKGKPSPNEVRVMTSKMWKETTPEMRKPFEDEAAELKNAYLESRRKWEEECKEWDRKYLEIRAAWEKENKLSLSDDSSVAAGREQTDESSRTRDQQQVTDLAGGRGGRRSRRKVNSYAESDGEDVRRGRGGSGGGSHDDDDDGDDGDDDNDSI